MGLRKTESIEQDAIRKFGVDEPDAYWQERQQQARTSERRLHRFLSDLIDEMFPEQARVLDCGVGSGHVFRLCRQKHDTYGVEISSEAIGTYDFPTDHIIQADLNQGIPAFGVKFDAIIVSMVLHWLDDPGGFLRQAKANLLDKGRVVAVIPNITYYRYRIAYLFGKFPPISLSHKNFQVPYEVEQMCRQSGYAVERKLTPKKTLRARLWPNIFGTDIVYVLKPL